jgi:hypothetical protein
MVHSIPFLYGLFVIDSSEISIVISHNIHSKLYVFFIVKIRDRRSADWRLRQTGNRKREISIRIWSSTIFRRFRQVFSQFILQL